MAAYRYIIAGGVQGVGFRWFVARHARELGLTGFAHNRPDGSVEVQVAGSEASIAALEPLLRSGPASARVDRVDRSEVSLEEHHANVFEIR